MRGQIYGRTVTQLDMQRNVRMFELARSLGMFTYLQDMIGSAGSEQAAKEQFVWNRLVLRHEAEQLGIAPSGADVARVIKTLQPFQGERVSTLRSTTSSRPTLCRRSVSAKRNSKKSWSISSRWIG
jgi:hypothetical protein